MITHLEEYLPGINVNEVTKLEILMSHFQLNDATRITHESEL